MIPEVAGQPGTDLVGRVRTLLQNKETRRFLKFFAVGTLGAAIDFTTLHVLDATDIFKSASFNTPFGFPIDEIGIVGACGFTAAVISNFIWNRYWVYPDSRSKSIRSQMVTFFLINLVGLIIRTPILEILKDPFIGLVHTALPHITPDLTDSIGKSMAWALSVIAVMLWNFFVNRYWTYNDVK
jgi:putative flippase GtrA